MFINGFGPWTYSEKLVPLCSYRAQRITWITERSHMLELFFQIFHSKLIKVSSEPENKIIQYPPNRTLKIRPSNMWSSAFSWNYLSGIFLQWQFLTASSAQRSLKKLCCCFSSSCWRGNMSKQEETRLKKFSPRPRGKSVIWNCFNIE